MLAARLRIGKGKRVRIDKGKSWNPDRNYYKIQIKDSYVDEGK